MDCGNGNRGYTSWNSKTEVSEENVNDSPLVESLTKILQTPESYSEHCIYRVPQPLRSVNPKAYTPKVISIGPLHYNTPDLIANNRHKSRYLRDLLFHMNLYLLDVLQCLKPLVQKVRGSYSEPIEMKDDDFAELFILDACFIVMYIIGSQLPEFRDKDISFLWRFGNGIYCDLILLENQLPFFLLNALYKLCASSSNLLQRFKFSELASQYFSDANEGNCVERDVRENDNEINHFVHLLRMKNFICSCFKKQEPNFNTSFCPSIWPPTATELYKCGVSVFMMKSKNINNMDDIEFIENDKVLKLPQIIVSETSEIQLRNLIAYEQCHGSRLITTLTNDVCNFALFLSYLINTTKDVELLINDGIIQNNLGSIKEVTSFFNNLAKNLPIRRNVYNIQCERMQNHCKQPRHQWMTSLRRDYFNSPWSIFSFVVALLLFVVTILQAVMAFVALHK